MADLVRVMQRQFAFAEELFNEQIANWTHGFGTTNRVTGFAGPCLDPAFDANRLGKQMGRVWDTMKDGQWRTLHGIAHATGDPESSISAQLRHLRKPKFGGYTVERRRADGGNGLWEYRVLA